MAALMVAHPLVYCNPVIPKVELRNIGGKWGWTPLRVAYPSDFKGGNTEMGCI